jgi:hypothetical protein
MIIILETTSAVMPGSRTFWERTDGSLGFEVLQAEHIKNVAATLKMEAVSSSEILVTNYKTTWRHSPERQSLT